MAKLWPTCLGSKANTNFRNLVFQTIFIFGTIGITCVSSRVAESDLFPHEPGDDESQRFGDDGFIAHNLTVPFTFFNKTYDTIFISPNGLVSFEQGVSSYTASCTASGNPLIMAFWSDVLVNLDRVNAKILYRETTDRALLNKVSQDVFKGFPELRGIRLLWMFILTYKEVPFYGAGGCTNHDAISKRNTFQLVLTSDGKHSFALMYYSKIEWTTGTASGGSCLGLGGSPAKAGFDYGDGSTWYTIGGSCTSSILNIPQTTNIEEPGKWVFRIDSNLETAACEEFEGAGKKLRLTPSIMPYMGSVPLELEGPCITEGVEYSCIFHDTDQDAIIELEEQGLPSADFKKIICPMPHLNRIGRVKVELEARPAPYEFRGEILPDVGEKVYSGYLYVVNHAVSSDHFRLSFTRSKDDPEKVFMNATWDPLFFKREVEIEIDFKRRRRRRSVSMPEQSLDMVVETFDGVRWTDRGILQQRVANTGHYHGVMEEDSKSLVDELLSSPHPQWISIHLKRTEQEGEINWSKLVASLVNSVEQLYNAFPNPFARQCEEWGRQQGPIPNDTLPCPPTIQLALVDQNFQKDGSGFTLPFWHPGASHSLRQRVPSTSKAGSQCVYGDDGALMVGPMGGGTLDRYSPNYDVPMHLLHDVLPYLTCCRLSGSRNFQNCANIYYRHRPSDDGTKYVRPRPIRAVGDPHITTFDGLPYTFNGVGEFTMVQVEEPNIRFRMQARMEQYVSPQGVPMNASVYTAAVMEEILTAEGNLTSIQVSYANGRIVVLLGEESPDFGEDTPWGFSMRYKTAFVTFESVNKVIVSFSSGFNFEFETAGENEMLMNIVGMSSSSYRTKGLFGNNDGIMDNDFECPDGTILPRESMTPEKIHHDFGMKWLIKEDSSAFTYSPGKSYDDYENHDFEPRFLNQEDIEGISQSIRDQCDNKIECIYDRITTGSEELAIGTKQASQNFDEVVEIVSKPVRMCPSMKSPENSLAEITNLFVGGTVGFSCLDGFEFRKGPRNCTCVDGEDESYPKWNCVSDQVKCKAPGEPSDDQCDPPPSLENGEVVELGAKSNYSIGSKVELKCNDGRDIFWNNCRFNGKHGLCNEHCDVIYECVTKGDQAVWEGYAGEIEKVRCLTKFAGNLATFLKKKTIVLHEAMKQERISELVKLKPHLLGC